MCAMFFSRSIDDFGGKIPFIVTDLVEKLRESGCMTVEGVFRVNGSNKEVWDMIIRLDNGRIKDWGELKGVHTVASVLKKYFRDKISSDALFPSDIYEKIVRVSAIKNREEQVEAMKEALSSLSKPKMLTIAYLFRFLHEIYQNASVNKMEAHNLAIVFAPTLFSAITGTTEQLLQSNAIQNSLITLIIKNSPEIFQSVEISESDTLTDEEIELIECPSLSQTDIDHIVMLRDIRKKSRIPYIPENPEIHTLISRPTRHYVHMQ